jgi:hypothetical protein|tara:strand:- start:42 stop:506 length:465 start_codon:yes stop_codon:yes gene_type:complete
MAHYAKISEENQVLQVLALDDKDNTNDANVEVESLGQQYLETHNNWPAHLWIKTSYNTYENTHREGGTPFRGNYATIGGEWDNTNQIFWPEKPFPSWEKDISNAKWKAPIDAPALTAEQQAANDAETAAWVYQWNENAYQEDNTTGWDLTDISI